jgi:hypothetical protein
MITRLYPKPGDPPPPKVEMQKIFTPIEDVENATPPIQPQYSNQYLTGNFAWNKKGE